VWDLDVQQQAAVTPIEATGIRAMAWHPDGAHVFSALADGLRVWRWEPGPPTQMDNVDIPWSKVLVTCRQFVRACVCAVLEFSQFVCRHTDRCTELVSQSRFVLLPRISR
jgi:hypothetical protein